MKNKLIISIGSNIKNPEGFNPLETCKRAINELEKFNVNIVHKSSWYITDPIPKRSMPKFYNAVLI